MSIHSRKDSPHLSVRIPVPTQDGGVKPLILSTGTDDPAVAKAMERAGNTVGTLGRKPSALRVRAFAEAILEAAGHASPWAVGEVERSFWAFSKDYRDRQERKGKAVSSAVLLEFDTFAGKPVLSGCTPEVLQRYHDSLVDAKLAPGTIGNKLACLSGVFRHAVALGLMASNPVPAVDSVQAGAVLEREAFPDPVLARFLGWLLDSSEPDAESWYAACMLGRYAGMSLLDAVNASGESITWEDPMFLRYSRKKTGSSVVQPVFSPLREWLVELPEPLEAHFCPALAGKPASVLSARFCELLEKAGCAGAVVTTPSGREMRERTFHSLRAAYVTWLVSLGIPEDLRMKLSGHARASVHRGYDKTAPAALASLLAPYFAPHEAAHDHSDTH